MCRQVIEEVAACGYDVFGAVHLSSTDGTEGCGESGVARAAVPDERDDNVLDMLDLLGREWFGRVCWDGVLEFGSVDNRGCKVRRVLWTVWLWVLVFRELSFNVAVYGYVDVTHDVVPVKSYDTE